MSRSGVGTRDIDRLAECLEYRDEHEPDDDDEGALEYRVVDWFARHSMETQRPVDK